MIRRKIQFSLRSLLFAACTAALCLTAYQFFQQLWKTQRELTAAKRQLESSETLRDTYRKRIEREFVGTKPAPILAIHPHKPTGSLELIRVINSKHTAQELNSVVGAFSDVHQPRRWGFQLKLLRTLDGTDYYRLRLNPSGYLPLKPITLNAKVQEELVFAYRGKPIPLYSDDTMAVAIGPSVKQSVAAMLSGYEPETAAALKKKWLDGPGDPIPRTIQRPSR